MSAWRSWGAIPHVFDTSRAEFDDLREHLATLLTPAEMTAARRTVLNAHYTDPAIIAPIWDAARDFGYDPAVHRVLEPGCGAGGFLAHAPNGAAARIVGIEVDPVTADLAAALHPDADIRAESFVHTTFAEGYFDLAIGNVPFSDVVLHDPRHNRPRLSMHNYFLVKSLDLVAPGGLVVALTSRYTLDSRSTTARVALHERADLLGAIRLPSSAHRAYAGTDVVTDLLVLRRREPGQTPLDGSWVESVPHPDLDGLRINAHFHQHPRRILGDLATVTGRFSTPTLRVAATDPTATAAAGLAKALPEIAAAARRDLSHRDNAIAPRGVESRTNAVLSTDRDRVLPEPPRPVATAANPALTIGYLSMVNGVVHHRTRAGLEPAGVPRTQQAEVAALLALRDTALALLTAQAETTDDTPSMDRMRATLNRDYDTYVDRYGPINRYTLSSRTNPRTGETKQTRLTPGAVKVLRRDPFAATVKALEIFDEDTQSAEKAAIFRERVVATRRVPTTASTPADALAISLDTQASVDLDLIAELLNVQPDAARTALGDRVFADPLLDGRLVPRPEYLSGDVRAKHAAAVAAANADPAYRVNIDALSRVIPDDLGPGEIAVGLGAVWVPASDVQTFLRELLDDPTVHVHHYGGAEWTFSGSKSSIPATVEWGTPDRDVFDLAESLATQRPIIVRRTIETPQGERSVPDLPATAAAQQKAADLNARFADWLWEDPDRTDRLVRVYNDTFNSIVLREYDTTSLTLPGLAATFTPRPHQVAAVARMLYEPAVGLFHEVGAGKTAEMVIGCMELRRLGLAHKPGVIVPNHMLEQFGREWLQLYPQAQILAASTDDLRTPDDRHLFAARAATGDWDAVILTQSAFSRIPVSAAAEAEHVQAASAALRDRQHAATLRGDSKTVKKAEKQALAAEERLRRALDQPRDQGLTFEMTGIDYLCVDELHLFKNLPIESSDRSMAHAGSARATDLDLKISLLRRKAGPEGRVITGATATPIANSISEMYVMQHYLRPDLLHNVGITDFDSWAAVFGTIVTDLELAPTGTKYRTSSRFAQFKNVPELLRLWGVAGDVKTGDDLNLPVPELRQRGDGDRTPEIVPIAATPATAVYVDELAARAEDIRSVVTAKEDDNMLAVTTDGRAAALDLRLLLRPGRRFKPHQLDDPDTTGTKITRAADRIHDIWERHRATPYLDQAGQPHPLPGALQIVFCDLGTPTGDHTWNAYDELRDQLVSRGMHRQRIRFVHDAPKDVDKARLFNACRSGQVDVIIGSTEKMGVGTNIQARAVALHHLDCPWRPADIAQREGRILRQGNQNPEVQIIRYVTTKTFDAYLWQTVERKAKFIAQVMRGRLDVREIEDVGNGALSFAEVKAISSGDPHTLRRAQAEAAVTKLERTAAGYERGQAALRRRVRTLRETVSAAEADLPLLRQALARRVPPAGGDKFTMTVDGQHHATRAEASRHLGHILGTPLPAHTTRAHPHVVQVGGHAYDLLAHASAAGDPTFTFTLVDVPRVTVTVDHAASHDGIITRLTNRITGLDTTIRTIETDLHNATTDLARAERNLSTPFPQAAELTAARAALDAVMTDIAQAAQAASEESEAKPGAAGNDTIPPQVSVAVSGSFPSTPGSQSSAKQPPRAHRQAQSPATDTSLDR